ncbi:patatin-like phospholipase family protein [Agarivorans gilvus]|uniref:Patatin family protein n=1 Tax=Agarivorans gilvus TaxID=680279 RepID=A0ABQ1HZV0_9ALTE|nr:patatin family protein [Agarivorans gilvus]GGA99130.1 patatin family protein [Agarivorans gilvus]
MTQQIGPNALIVEGGAKRGVFSCGVLDSFLAQDFSPFDSFWGVSAGASNLAAYLANMPGRNLKIYTDYSCRREFVRPGQFLRGGDLMDLDWMWTVTLAELGIDMHTLKQESRPFFLGVTRQDTGAAEYHRPKLALLTETMKASSAVPIAYRRGVLLGGVPYVDGGVADAIPVAEAIRRGAKRIMVLRSRPSAYRKSPVKAPGLMRHLLRHTPALIEPMLTRDIRYNQAVDLIESPPHGVEIVQICPPDNFQLKRLSRDTKSLQQAYQNGVEAGKGAIKAWNSAHRF